MLSAQNLPAIFVSSERVISSVRFQISPQNPIQVQMSAPECTISQFTFHR